MTPVELYQTLHIHRGRVRLTAEHVVLLDDASRKLFQRPYTPDLHQLERRLTHCAAAANYPCGVSGFVRLTLTPDGEERLTPAGVSLYSGYALRSLHPDAVTLRYDLPLGCAPTPAREASASLARLTATCVKASAAVQHTSDGLLLAADDAPLYGIIDKTVFASPFPAAERTLTRAAIAAAGYSLSDESLRYEHLPFLLELFWIDHRGVTALAHCDGYPLISLAAERVATQLETLFQNR